MTKVAASKERVKFNILNLPLLGAWMFIMQIMVFGVICKWGNAWPQGYEMFFMLNSIEHEISTAHKN